MKTGKPIAIAVMGPTASGKSALAESLARRLACRVLNADAFQVYRGLDIGTNKPADRSLYELLDVCEPWEEFTVGRFVQLATELIEREFGLGRHVVVCGGTGLYVRALFEGYDELKPPADPALRARLQAEYADLGPEGLAERYSIELKGVSPATRVNPRHFVRLVERRLLSGTDGIRQARLARKLKFGLRWEKTELDRRIALRVREMLQNGWLEEVAALRAQGARRDWPGMRAIGYVQLLDVLEGSLSLTEAVTKIESLTRQYAKRQMTWLRKEPGLRLLDGRRDVSELSDEIVSIIDSFDGGCDGEGD